MIIPTESPSQKSITLEPSLDTTSPEEIPENTPYEAIPSNTLPLLDLNTATQADFESLPYIGAQKASEIMAYRESIGVFSSVEELMDVSGIGDSIYQKIAPLVTISSE